MNCNILLSQTGNSDTQDQQFTTLPSANDVYHSNGSSSGSVSPDGWGLGYAHHVPVESTCSASSEHSLSCEEYDYLPQPYIIDSPTQLPLQGNPSVKTMLSPAGSAMMAGYNQLGPGSGGTDSHNRFNYFGVDFPQNITSYEKDATLSLSLKRDPNPAIGMSAKVKPHRIVHTTSSGAIACWGKEDTSVAKSRLLEDLHNYRYPNLQLHDLTNHVVEFSLDQYGSRFIQQKLERASFSDKQSVFAEILSNSYKLMTDVYANHVIQKFLQYGSYEQKQTLVSQLKGNVINLTLNMYGCRVIQKALETVTVVQQV